METKMKAADKLWLELMKNEAATYESVRKKWKVANNKEAECVLCEDFGGGALIRCSSEKCGKYFHLDCAFNHGGLSLDDEGVLTCECDVHFKPILFCSCKTKYDNMKPMVYCDECCDWFHESCEKLDPNELEEMETYTCVACTELLKSGKSISKSTKEKNIEKDRRSGWNQNATKIVGLLAELAGGACPVIDSMNGIGDDLVKVWDVSDILSYLTSPPFVPKPDSTETEEELRFLQLMGVEKVVKSWARQCDTFLSIWKKWFDKFKSFSSTLVNKLNIPLNDTFHESFNQYFEELKSLELLRQSDLKFVSQSNFEEYAVITDCIKWLQDFLQALFTKSKSENWTTHLHSLVRTVQSKTKKINSVCKEEYAKQFASWFLQLVKVGSELMGKVVIWHNNTCKVLNQENEFKLYDIIELVNAAQSFPSLPPLFIDLSQHLQKCEALEIKFTSCLQQTTVEETFLQSINAEKSNLSVLLTSEHLLSAINERVIFLKAYEMAIVEGRAALAVAQSLLAEGMKAAANNIANESPPPLLQALESKLQDALSSLTQKMEEAKCVVQEFDGSKPEDEELFTKLKQLMIVTPEEELLQFLKDVGQMISQAKKILNGEETIHLQDLDILAERLSTAHMNRVVDSFAQGQARKADIRRILSSILDKQTTAQKQWNILSNAIGDLSHGVSITKEVLLELFELAQKTSVKNDAVSENAIKLITRGEELDRQCDEELGNITVVTPENVHKLQTLVDLVKHNPLSATIGSLIRLRYETWSTVLACQEILTTYSSSQEENLDEKMLLHSREVRNNIQRLEGKLLQSTDAAFEVERNVLESVKNTFFLFQWKQEVKYMLTSPLVSSLHHAEKLQIFADHIGQELVATTKEWQQLLDSIEECKGLTANVHQLTASIHEVLSSLGENIMGTVMMDSGDMTVTNVEKLFGMNIQGLWQAWNEKVHPIIQQAHTLHNMIHIKKVVQDESIIEINDSHSLITILDACMACVHQLDEAQLDTVLSSSAKDLLTLTPTLDMKDIIAFINKLTVLKEKHSNYWVVMKFFDLMNVIYHQACQWMEKYAAMIPNKVTRTKTRNDVKLAKKEDIFGALSEPINRLIATPVRDKLVGALIDAEQFHETLLQFLIPLKTGDSISMDITQPTTTLAFNTLLQEDIAKLAAIKTTADIIPLDLPDSYVLQWAYDVLSWMLTIPRPSDPVETASIHIDQAQQKMKDAIPIICELPSALVHYLAELGMMNLDPSKGPVGFQEYAHPILKRAGEYYDFLEKQVKQCEDFEEAVDEAYSMDASRERLRALYDQMKIFYVVPDSNIKRTLEKLISAKSIAEADQLKAGIITTKSGRTSKKKFSDDFYFDHYDGGAPPTPPSSGNIKIPTVGDHFLPPKVIEKEKEAPRRLKKSRLAKCAAQGCMKEIKANSSSFCSCACAFKTAHEMASSVVRYKSLIDKYQSAMKGNRKNSAQQLLDLHKLKPEDILAWEIDELSISASFDGQNNNATTKKPSLMQNLQSLLPKVSANIVNLDNDEVVATKAKHLKSLELMDISMRLKARSLLEDLFMTVLQKLQQEGSLSLGALLSLELEESLFHKYYTKQNEHAPFDKREYRKHYLMLMHNLKQAHNESLILKLVRSEVTMEQLLGMSAQNLADTSTQLLRQKQLHSIMEDALKKSTEEEWEEKRRQVMAGQAEAWRSGGSNAVVEAPLSLSTKATPAPEMPELAADTSIDASIDTAMMDLVEFPESPRKHNGEDTSASSSTSSSISMPTSRSLEIEQKVLASQQKGVSANTTNTTEATRVPKRSMDADSVTRFTTSSNAGKPAKVPRLDEVREESMSKETPLPSPSSRSSTMTSLESPKNKAPSLLEILKSSHAGSSDSQDNHDSHHNNHHNNHGGKGLKDAGGVDYAAYTPSMRLVSKENTESFTITRPGGVVMKVTAMVNEKRVQGCVKNVFNIDGRTRIAELDKFVKELISLNRKIVATTTFLVNNVQANDSTNSYTKFCEEFSKDERAGISNIENHVQVYIIPPALKAHISILKTLQPDNTAIMQNQGLLFGIIVSKTPGPSAIVNRHHPVVPYAINSFASFPAAAAGEVVVAKPPVAATVPTTAATVTAIPSTFSATTALKINPAAAPLLASQISPTAMNTGNVPRAFDSLKPIQQQGSIAALAQAIGTNRPIVAPIVTPQINPMTMTIPVATPKAQLSDVEKDRIRQVADFCARKGVAKLQSLKENPESKTIMPFLFEGSPGYEEFMQTLKEIVGVGSGGPPASQQTPSQQLPISPQQTRPGMAAFPNPNDQHSQYQPSFGERKSRFSK